MPSNPWCNPCTGVWGCSRYCGASD
jgi:hypothetical protein